MAPVDVAAPALTLTLSRRLRAGRALRVGTRCSEACSLTYAIVLDTRSARRLHVRRTAARRTLKLTKASTQTLTLRLPRALRKLKSGRLTVRVAAVDAAGNRTTKTVSVRLVR